MKKVLLLIAILATSVLDAQTLPNYIPSNGLIGWWPFSGNSLDVSGNGNNGITTTAALTSDRDGNTNSAYQLGNGIITLPQGVFEYQRNQFFSISLWFTHSASGNARLISTECPEGNFRIANIGGNGIFATQYGDYIQDTLTSPSDWNHFVYTYSNRNETIFINGQLVSTNYDLSTESLNYCNPLCLGAKASSTNNDRWNGKIDDLGIWSRALTIQEIQDLYVGCADTIQQQPQSNTFFTVPGDAYFSITHSDTAATYQWQENSGNGWSNLNDFGIYDGTTTDSLILTGVTTPLNNYGFRCLVNSCTMDTTDLAILTIVDNIGVNEVVKGIVISPNPTSGILNIVLTSLSEYKVFNVNGQSVAEGKTEGQIDITNLPAGSYQLIITNEDGRSTNTIQKI